MHGMLLGLWLAFVNVLLFAADEGLVALKNLAGAAERASLRVGLHRFANAHAEKPRALVRDIEHAL